MNVNGINTLDLISIIIRLRILSYRVRLRQFLRSKLTRSWAINTKEYFLSNAKGSDDRLDVKISIIIPTLNAGEDFDGLLSSLNGQKGLNIEIIVVDSGSSDNTLRYAREHGCTLIQINKDDFTHSYARNLGAEHARGDYLLFTVQDAMPTDSNWCSLLFSSIKSTNDPKLVAVSCIETPKKDCDIFGMYQIDAHYKAIGCNDGDRLGFWRGNDINTLRRNAFLSDVTCMINKEVFFRYKYRGTFGEDVDLALRLIRDGYKIAMLSSVQVVHSHNRPPDYYLKRSTVDTVFMKDMYPDFKLPEVIEYNGLCYGLAWISCSIFKCIAEGRSLYISPKRIIEGLSKTSRLQNTINPTMDFDIKSPLLDSTLKHLLDSSIEMQNNKRMMDSKQLYLVASHFITQSIHLDDFFKKENKSRSLKSSEVSLAYFKLLAVMIGSYSGALYTRGYKDPSIYTLGEMAPEFMKGI
jgi:glycosyltransferase involved in cell wall biosynthesis